MLAFQDSYEDRSLLFEKSGGNCWGQNCVLENPDQPSPFSTNKCQCCPSPGSKCCLGRSVGRVTFHTSPLQHLCPGELQLRVITEAQREAKVDMRTRVRLRSSPENGEEWCTSLLIPWVGCRDRGKEGEKRVLRDLQPVHKRQSFMDSVQSLPVPSPSLPTLPGWVTCGPMTCGQGSLLSLWPRGVVSTVGTCIQRSA